MISPKTEEIHKAYFDNPNLCPYCQSSNFDRMEQDNDDAYLWLTWSCSSPDCGKSWTEEYILRAIFLEGDE
jgi:hypothetical protein